MQRNGALVSAAQLPVGWQLREPTSLPWEADRAARAHPATRHRSGAFTIYGVVPARMNETLQEADYRNRNPNCTGMPFNLTLINTNFQKKLDCIFASSAGEGEEKATYLCRGLPVSCPASLLSSPPLRARRRPLRAGPNALLWEQLWNGTGKCTGMTVGTFYDFVVGRYSDFNANVSRVSFCVLRCMPPARLPPCHAAEKPRQRFPCAAACVRQAAPPQPGTARASSCTTAAHKPSFNERDTSGCSCRRRLPTTACRRPGWSATRCWPPSRTNSTCRPGCRATPSEQGRRRGAGAGLCAFPARACMRRLWLAKRAGRACVRASALFWRHQASCHAPQPPQPLLLRVDRSRVLERVSICFPRNEDGTGTINQPIDCPWDPMSNITGGLECNGTLFMGPGARVRAAAVMHGSAPASLCCRVPNPAPPRPAGQWELCRVRRFTDPCSRPLAPPAAT